MAETKVFCAACGKEVLPNAQGRPRKFCNDECKRAFHNAQRSPQVVATRQSLHEQAFGIPGVEGWDNPLAERLDADIDWHPRVDAGMKVRCFECMSQLRQANDIRCEACSFKHARRVRLAARALDDC